MKPALDFETQLKSVPVRNVKLNISVAENDPAALLVEVALVYRGLLGVLAPMVGARRTKRYELAGLARELFESLDGKLTVENLIDNLRMQEKLTFLEARALVIQYLKDLMQRGLVVIVAESTGKGE